MDNNQVVEMREATSVQSRLVLNSDKILMHWDVRVCDVKCECMYDFILFTTTGIDFAEFPNAVTFFCALFRSQSIAWSPSPLIACEK